MLLIRRYFVDANIFDVFCMAGWYNKPVQCGRESGHKRRAARGNSTLCDCMWRDQHLLGEVGEHQRGLEEVSCCGLCRAKTVRRCLHACANILSMPVFCRRQHFVDANILPALIFCRHQCFAGANILLTPMFAGTNILSPPMFCWRQYFVDANVLPAPIFCQR
jgi:hypothetical protein